MNGKSEPKRGEVNITKTIGLAGLEIRLDLEVSAVSPEYESTEEELTMEITVKSASKAEQDAVIGVVTAAFLTDPIARWMYPEAHQYFAVGDSFTRAFAGNAFSNGSAYYVDGYAGAALWLPPGIHPDEDALMALLKGTIAKNRQENAFALFEQMGNYHPEEPH